MRKKEKKLMCVGILMMAAFALWTACIQTVDVAPVGQDGTNIGFATLNCWFHSLTGVHMAIYTITDWLGLVPIGICINGLMEASYPSSTTLLVLSVLPTLSFQAKRRMKNHSIRNLIHAFSISFSLFMVIGRTIAGVHWLTDIVGSILLSMGLYLIYRSGVLLLEKKAKS